MLKVFFCEKVLKGLTLIALWCAVPSHFFLCPVRVLSCKTVENVMCILAEKTLAINGILVGMLSPPMSGKKKLVKRLNKAGTVQTLHVAVQL